MSNLQQYFRRLEEIPWLRYELWDNTLARWGLAVLIAFVVFSALKVVIKIAQRQARRFSDATATGWDDGIAKTMQATRGFFLLLIAVYIASLALDLPERARDATRTVAILALLLQAALWGSRLLAFSIEHYMSQRRESDPALATTVSAMSFVGNLVLWVVVLLLALDNMGIDVTALIAGLGVGGIAVALAAQNILGDLFASLSIVLDKPFVLGDFIIVGEQMGTVEKVGLKTTRVRSLTGEQLVFANTDLLQSRIRNFKRMYERRVVFSVGVLYETGTEKLKAIPEIIQKIVESQDATRFDRSHFKEFGNFSLNFETVYYVLTPDYNVYMNVQQAINLELFEEFASREIEFAYPTQKLLLERAG